MTDAAPKREVRSIWERTPTLAVVNFACGCWQSDDEQFRFDCPTHRPTDWIAQGDSQVQRCLRFHPSKDDSRCIYARGHDLPHRCEPPLTDPAEWFGDERDWR